MSEEAKEELSEEQKAKAAKNMAKITAMGTEPMARLIIRYSLPAIAGLLVTALYGLVDGIFIGIGVGDAGIAATTVAMPFMVITMALNTLIGNGGNIVASIRLGEGRHAEAEKSLGNAIMWLIITWIVLMVVCLPLVGPIVTACGATEASYDYSVQYLTIMIVGFIAGGLSGGIGNYIRTAGAPNTVMAFMIIAAGLNIVFDYFAVIVFGWEIIGAAWATIVSQTIAAVLTMIFFTRKTSSIRFRMKYLKLEKQMTKDIFRLGLAGFFMNALMAITSVIINQLFIYYGDMDVVTGTGALAAYGASGRLQQIFFQFIVGISIAAQPILGYNFGAQYMRRVRKCFWTSANIGFVALLVAMIIAMLIPELILSMFQLAPTTLAFAVYVMRAMMSLIPLAAYGIMAGTYFMATNQAGIANLTVLLRQIILLVPFLFLCPIFIPALIPSISPVAAIVLAFPIVDIFSTIISMLFMKRDLKKLKARIANGESKDTEDLVPAEMPTLVAEE